MLNVLARIGTGVLTERLPAPPRGARLRSLIIPSVAATMVLSLGKNCLAQDPTQPLPARREFESRTELEAQAKAAETQHRSGEAWLLRQRLEKGDFQDGDRILFKVRGNALAGTAFLQFPDTLVVRAGRKVELPQMADMSLDGVIRSELNDRLTTHIAGYVKEPTVRSVPLVRLAILGSVGHPGYLYTSADAPLSDVLMQAGGPGANADMAAVTIRRGEDVIWNAQDTKAAFADGLSVDRLHLRAGDEIMVPEQSHFPWLAALTTGLGMAALLFTIFRK